MRRPAAHVVFGAIGVAAALAMTGGAAATAPQSRGPLEVKAPLTYFIADGDGAKGFRAGDRQLAEWALRAWERSAGGRLRLEATSASAALIRLYWASPQDGQYGEMRPLVVGGRPGAAVYIRPDMDALGPEIAQATARDPLLRESIVYLTCVHELGHAFGLDHTRAYQDIMYFFGYGGDVAEYFGRYRRLIRSRDDIAALSGISDNDVSRLNGLYGKP